MQFRVWQILTFFVQRMPERVCYAAASVAGTVGFYCWPRGRRATLRNFSHVMPAAGRAQQRRAARASIVNYCRYLADFIRFPSLPAEEVSVHVDWSGALEHLDRALERGRGALIVCMHFGNWDAGAGAAAAAGYPLSVVVEPFPDARLDRMVAGARERLGMTIIRMDKAGPSLLRCLKKNGLLALLIDRPVPGEGVRVPFFGQEVEVPAGPARLALRTGAAVIPAAFARISPGSPKVVALTDFSIDFAPTGDDARDVRCLTQAIMAVQERFIRQYPEQWYMFREMWPRVEQGESAGSG